MMQANPIAKSRHQTTHLQSLAPSQVLGWFAELEPWGFVEFKPK